MPIKYLVNVTTPDGELLEVVKVTEEVTSNDIASLLERNFECEIEGVTDTALEEGTRYERAFGDGNDVGG